MMNYNQIKGIIHYISKIISDEAKRMIVELFRMSTL